MSDEVELLRKQNWQARQRIGTLENEMSRLRKEAFDYRDGFMEASAEVERLKLDVDWLQTPMRKRHEALLQAAKDHLDVAGCFESEPLCEAIDACEKEDHREHIDLCRKQVVELLEAKTKEVDHEDE